MPRQTVAHLTLYSEIKGIKNLDLQFSFSLDIVMTVVGVLIFTSLILLTEQLYITTMQKVKTTIIQFMMSLFLSLSCGVTLVE
jgi:hypothetical protein